MSDTCLNCKGLILEPNKVYGYAGPVCFCPKNPAHIYQRPASKEVFPPRAKLTNRDLRYTEMTIWKEPEEYLSLAEHAAILAEKDQRIKKLKEALEKIRNLQLISGLGWVDMREPVPRKIRQQSYISVAEEALSDSDGGIG